MKKFKSNGATFNLLEEADVSDIKNTLRINTNMHAYTILPFAIKADSSDRTIAFHITREAWSSMWVKLLGSNGDGKPVDASCYARWDGSSLGINASGTETDKWSSWDAGSGYVSLVLNLPLYSSGIIICGGSINGIEIQQNIQ